ncbi:hypothetical protein [Kitasatospora sp. NPDC047058]|uniref:hypothetical protein n=1 Tax=Kitasatospora sp. NPDC047058 TaxID=3155620 RepID=UPI0033E9D3BA
MTVRREQEEQTVDLAGLEEASRAAAELKDDHRAMRDRLNESAGEAATALAGFATAGALGAALARFNSHAAALDSTLAEISSDLGSAAGAPDRQ